MHHHWFLNSCLLVDVTVGILLCAGSGGIVKGWTVARTEGSSAEFGIQGLLYSGGGFQGCERLPAVWGFVWRVHQRFSARGCCCVPDFEYRGNEVFDRFSGEEVPDDI